MPNRISKGLAFAVGAGAALALVNCALARRIERRWPPRGRFMTIGDCRLHYVARGQGQPVVLLHGASGSLNDFMLGLFDRVAREYRAIAIDRPGHGYSSRPRGPMSPARQAALLRRGLRVLGVQRPILVGHSWSGALVLAYALAWPDEIAGIVTVAGVSHPWTGNYLSWHTHLGARPLLGALFRHTVLAPLGQALIGPGVRNVFAPEIPPPGYTARAGVPLLLRPGQFQANAYDLIGLNAFLARQSRHYPNIHLPVGIVAPSQDRRITNVERHSYGLHRRLPRSRLFVAEGAGHMPHHTHPGIVLDAIRWVKTESARASNPARGPAVSPDPGR